MLAYPYNALYINVLYCCASLWRNKIATKLKQSREKGRKIGRYFIFQNTPFIISDMPRSVSVAVSFSQRNF